MKSFYLALALFLGCALPAFSQNVRVDGVVQSAHGPAPNVFIAVCSQPANLSVTPCATRVPLCSSLTDAVCTSPNPVASDGLGNYFFYIPAGGTYTYQFYGAGLQTRSFVDQQPGSATSTGGVSLNPSTDQTITGQHSLFLNGGSLSVTNTVLSGFDDALEALGVPIVSTSTPNERYNGHYSQYGWNGTSPTAGIESSGYFASATVSGGSTTGNLVGFLDFQPNIVGGSTVFTYLAFYCDHAAVSSTQVTGPHICFSGYTGAGGWGGDFYGSGTGGSVALGIGRICHSTDAIANGGTPTDCWYAPGIFSSLPACSSTNEGSHAAVTDSSTATWGGTITGSSTNHVLAYCDGTNWTVAAK